MLYYLRKKNERGLCPHSNQRRSATGHVFIPIEGNRFVSASWSVRPRGLAGEGYLQDRHRPLRHLQCLFLRAGGVIGNHGNGGLGKNVECIIFVSILSTSRTIILSLIALLFYVCLTSYFRLYFISNIIYTIK